jgi:phospholipid transport system substrate-binding protein
MRLVNFAAKVLLTLGLLLGMVCTYADTVQNPQDFVQVMVDSLQKQIAGRQDELQNNPRKLYSIIQATVIPKVDIDRMAGLALGPKWRSATPEQQKEFVDDFGLLLTKTYANAILTITDYQIIVNPLRGTSWQSSQYVSVNGAVVSQVNGQRSNLTYYLERSGDTWKIYDLAVEGVSFLKNYQSQFQSFNNMSSLLARIKALNDAPAANTDNNS